MRIIAGSHRGRRLTPVGAGDPAAQLRPTSDRVRESLFNMLSHRITLPGRRVLDLFAGTGALGLEALSRGAEHATFVENGRTALGVLTGNIALLDVTGQARVLRQDATRLPLAPADACDLIFLDPPYGRDLGHRAVVSAQAQGWVAPDAMIVWEEARPMIPPAGFALDEQRRYGDTWISLMTAPG